MQGGSLMVWKMWLGLLSSGWKALKWGGVFSAECPRHVAQPIDQKLREEYDVDCGFHDTAQLLLYDGTFEEAMQGSRYQSRPLAVYIHASEHSDTASFVTDTLGNPTLCRALRETIVLWAADASSAEGRLFTQKVEAVAFPLFCVVHTAGQGVVVHTDAGQGVVVLKVEGKVDAMQLMRRLNEACEICQSNDSQTRLVEESRRFREETATALAEALLVDTQALRERHRREQDTDAAREQLEHAHEQLELDRQQQLRRQRESLAALQQRLRASLPAEPDADAAGVLTLKISLPNGDSLHRRFSLSDPVQVVYDAVKCHQAYDGCDFHLSSYPCTHLDPSAKLSDYGLHSRAVVRMVPT
ncbi:Plant UBX domain-containing protein 10 [Diplonema papillatum]|nr:Plant UBX domain-containing protein 10 [Diplonema papillatum]